MYDVTGRPSPDDMNKIYKSLNEDRFNEAMSMILEIRGRKSLALEDVLLELHKGVMKTKFPDDMKIYLVSRMAEVEYRLTQGSNEKVQIASIVGAFIEVRSFKKWF